MAIGYHSRAFTTDPTATPTTAKAPRGHIETLAATDPGGGAPQLVGTARPTLLQRTLAHKGEKEL